MVLGTVPVRKQPNGCAQMQVLSRDRLVERTSWESQLLSCSSKAHTASYTL